MAPCAHRLQPLDRQVDGDAAVVVAVDPEAGYVEFPQARRRIRVDAEEVRPDVFLRPRRQRFGIAGNGASARVVRVDAVNVLFAHSADGSTPQQEKTRLLRALRRDRDYPPGLA